MSKKWKDSLILQSAKHHFENAVSKNCSIYSCFIFSCKVHISPSGKNLHRTHTCMFSPQVTLLGQEAL